MSWSLSLPSLPTQPSVSDVASRIGQTVTSTVDGVRDLGGAALSHASDLGRAGLDLGRQAVDAVASVDVRAAAETVRSGISSATETARDGITTGVNWTSQRVGDAADLARSQITGDDLVSQGLRGAISFGENSTRFQLGVVGGISREVVGTVGAAGQLATTVTEMQLSPEAARDYAGRVAGALSDGGEAVGRYAAGVAQDPGRVVSDAGQALGAARDFAGGQLDRYGQAIAEGRGAETIGMDAGTVLTYVVPVGGGPARGLATAAVREGTEAVVRTGANVAAREGTELAVRGGAAETATAATALRAGGRETIEGAAGLAIAPPAARSSELALVSSRTGTEAIAFRDPVLGDRIAGAAPEIADALSTGARSADDYGVAFFGQGNKHYYEATNATLGVDGRAFFHMPLGDAMRVTDAASAARYTGMSPSTLEAYKTGGDIFGVAFPRTGMGARVPEAADAMGWEHFLEGRRTAVRTGDGPTAGFLVNPTREFVIPGGQSVPEGSVLFRLGEGGAWEALRTF